MQSLVNDLIQVSRIEQGTFFLEPKAFSLEEMVADTVKEFQFYAKAANASKDDKIAEGATWPSQVSKTGGGRCPA